MLVTNTNRKQLETVFPVVSSFVPVVSSFVSSCFQLFPVFVSSFQFETGNKTGYMGKCKLQAVDQKIFLSEIIILSCINTFCLFRALGKVVSSFQLFPVLYPKLETKLETKLDTWENVNFKQSTEKYIYQKS